VPLARAVQVASERFGIDPAPCTLRIESDIPVGRGLGSGAAVAAATARAVAALAGRKPSPEDISDCAFEVEKIHHGDPSGVDNAVVSLERPVYFLKERAPLPLASPVPPLVLADSGTASSTAAMVARVRRLRQDNPGKVETILEQLGAGARRARDLLAAGDLDGLGATLAEAHVLLRDLGVSTERLDRLVEEALKAGAPGAKLSGAGGGGFMLALAPSQETADRVADALENAGATRVIRPGHEEGREGGNGS